MFSRGQPREVYRVYGEDDFFAEQEQGAEGYQDYPHSQGDLPQPEPPAQFEVPPEPIQHFAPAPEPIQHFAPAPEPAQRFAPAPAISQPVEYAPPTQSYEQPVAPVFAGEHRNGQPLEPEMLAASTGGVYGTGGARRRTGGLVLLAGVLGLLLGLLLISALRGGGTGGRQNASSTPAQTAPQVRTSVPSRGGASAVHSSHAPVAHQQAHSRAQIIVIRAPSRHVSHRPSAASTPRGAPVHSSAHSRTPQRLGSLAHFRAPAPASIPAPVSATAPSYAPPSSAQTGSEFGFEN
jgi:hypothetical protein